MREATLKGGSRLGAAVRPLVLVLALLAASSSVLAQGANETNGTNATNETVPTNETETPAGNETTEEPAAEEPAGPITIELEGVQEGSSYFFRDASGAKNPRIVVKPGQEVTFRLTSTAGVHNLNLGGVAKTALASDGETVEVVWTAPAEPTTLEYWCDPHKGNKMGGTLVVGEAAPPSSGGGEEGAITGETVDLGQYDPACAGKVAPAIVTTGITGSPTLDDYIAKCKPQTQGEIDDKHPADLVIPISWALIGLGIVGVVWVHKYYKP